MSFVTQYLCEGAYFYRLDHSLSPTGVGHSRGYGCHSVMDRLQFLCPFTGVLDILIQILTLIRDRERERETDACNDSTGICTIEHSSRGRLHLPAVGLASSCPPFEKSRESSGSRPPFTHAVFYRRMLCGWPASSRRMPLTAAAFDTHSATRHSISTT